MLKGFNSQQFKLKTKMKKKQLFSKTVAYQDVSFNIIIKSPMKADQIQNILINKYGIENQFDDEYRQIAIKVI